MFTLFRIQSLKQIGTEQLPTLLIAGVIAELFYKFGSFSLECIAFLATWFALDAAIQWLKWLLGREEGRATQ